MTLFVDAGSIYLHRDALVIIVEQEMELSPFSPALFVICNKNRDRVKVLYWEGLPHERGPAHEQSECFGCSDCFGSYLRLAP